jgi:hypothetical protein
MHTLRMALYVCAVFAAAVVASPARNAGSDAAASVAVVATTATVPRQAARTVAGGTWSVAGGRLRFITRDAADGADIPLAGRGYGAATHLAVDPFDDSAWITTDAPLLLHFSTSGALLGGTSLHDRANALDVALDQTPWLVVRSEVLHVSRAGDVLERHTVADVTDDEPAAFAVDSLRGRLWIAGAHSLSRIELHGGSAWRAVAVVDEPRAIALDVRSGDVWVLLRGALAVVDADGNVQLTMALPEDAHDAATLDYDAEHAVAIVRTPMGSLQISRDGHATAESMPATEETLARPAPLRITPTLSLIRPPAGGATYERTPALALHVGAACNTSPCDLPPTYAGGIALVTKLDGAATSNTAIDAASGEFFAAPTTPLASGVHVLTVRAVDRFGHDAELEAAFTVLERERPDVSASESSPSDANAPVAVVKAANKAPTVTLTSPANGATFTAGADITLTASATDVDGSIAKVEFYRNASTLVGSTATAPYVFVWKNVAAGSYPLSAKAYDNRNGVATSASVTVTVLANKPPAVTLSFPLADTFIGEGATIDVRAAATDTDGTVVRVDFYDGATPIGAATTAPFAITWLALGAGNHSLTARATDDKGGATTSIPVDVTVGQPPIVVVKAPVACSDIDEDAELLLAADAISANGSISRVEFFDGGVPVGVANVAPWSVTLAQPAAGAHSITARATDDRGLARTSRPALVTVRSANRVPSVSISSPSDGSRFPLGASVALTASASDSDGVVTAVEYRLDSGSGALIGRSTSAPYPVSWTGAAAATYTLVAIATDDRGAKATSPPVRVTVSANAPPSVDVTSPPADATYTAPATIALAATASDGDGTVAKVEFYANGALIGLATATPYAATWTGVSAGTYALTAKATDNRGATTTSAPVTIVVASNLPPTVTLRQLSGEQYFAPASIRLAADAADADGTISRLEFRANGALVGASSTPPYAYVWESVPSGTYSITATAVDDRGATTTTTAPMTIRVGGAVDVAIAGGLEGATVADDNVLVRGTVSAPPNAAMTINGVVTHIDDAGRFQANDVPLAMGANTITAIVTTQDGQTSSRTITLNSTGRGPFVVRAAPAEGLNSLTVAITVENPDNSAFARMTFDLDNDGLANVAVTPAQFSDGKLTVSATYPIGTWLAVVKAYDDQDRVIYSTSKSIVVLSPTVLQAKLNGIYDGMLNRLRAGNVQGALSAFTASARDRYGVVLGQLETALPSIIDQVGELTEFNFGIDLAELSVVRATSDGPRRFMLYMLRSEDGIWRFDGM